MRLSMGEEFAVGSPSKDSVSKRAIESRPARRQNRLVREHDPGDLQLNFLGINVTRLSTRRLLVQQTISVVLSAIAKSLGRGDGRSDGSLNRFRRLALP